MAEGLLRSVLGGFVCALLWLPGCAPAPDEPVGPAITTRSDRAEPASEQTATTRIVFLGDSLTAGFGLTEDQAFPALVERRLLEEGRGVLVVNAGVSGDTSAGGLNRLDWLLRQRPDILFVSLGANDGLRGLSPEMTESNLREIARRAIDGGAVVVLAGMRLPPNYGADYVERFEAVYPRLAEETGVGWLPFLLEGVAGEASLNLADGIHPNAEGHLRIADHVLPSIRMALAQVGA